MASSWANSSVTGGKQLAGRDQEDTESTALCPSLLTTQLEPRAWAEIQTIVHLEMEAHFFDMMLISQALS